MTFSWRFLLVPICCVVLCGCEASGPDAGVTDPEAPVNLGNASHARYFLTINFDQADTPNISYETRSETPKTVIDLLVEAAEKKKLEIDYSGSGETAFVMAIDGVVGGQNSNDWWIFYVNGELAHQGAGVYQLKSGDQVEWRLGKYQPADDKETSDNLP